MSTSWPKLWDYPRPAPAGWWTYWYGAVFFPAAPWTSDRRTQLVALTAAGQEKWQEAHGLLAECEKRLLGHLPPQRTQELAETLRTLINAW